jgi:hypothetical protein
MKTISRYFNQSYSKKLQSLGFSRSKSTFVRIRGDVLQAFTLKHSRNIPTCSVDFGIFPLCLPQPVFLDAGGYMLDEFIVGLYEGSLGWIFDANSDDSMMNCIESISEALDLYLLPFFETCCNCNIALPELIKLEELFDYNRQKRLQLRGDSDSAVPLQERSLFDSRKYYMALKARNLPYAQQYLNYQIGFYKTRLISFDKPNSPRQPDVVKERFTAKLALYLEQLERLESGDFTFFDDLLNSNENQMLELLSAKFPKICCDQ